ncbi:MAG: zinc-dependent alcohol dehydrogenase family protein [Anaerolineales bacterium]
MRAARLHEPADISQHPLQIEDIPRPEPDLDEILLKVRLCGLCHTDLHIAEGEVEASGYPVTPGHQVVGEVVELGTKVEGWQIGDRAGVPWLFQADQTCRYCQQGLENLCLNARFTGLHADGGFAEYMVAKAEFVLELPDAIDDEPAAPLLCAGIIGYRSLRLSEVAPGERLGLVGFGASAHLAIQVAHHWGCEVYVFTRSENHRRLARELGAAWVGGSEDQAPADLDRAIIFAPAGHLVPTILEKIRPGGTLAINAIHMSPIPEMKYQRIYQERTLRSVTNLTRQDGREFLDLAAEIPIEPTTRSYPLEKINVALQDLKGSRLEAAGVIIP